MQSCRNIASWHGDAFRLMGALWEWEESIGHWWFHRVHCRKCRCFLFVYLFVYSPRNTCAISQSISELRHIIVHIASQWWCYTLGIWGKYITERVTFPPALYLEMLRAILSLLSFFFHLRLQATSITSLIYFRGTYSPWVIQLLWSSHHSNCPERWSINFSTATAICCNSRLKFKVTGLIIRSRIV